MPAWLQILVWAGAGVGALYMLVTKGVVPLWNFVVAANRLAEAVPTLMDIHAEFQPNGGDSLADKVQSLVAGQEKNTQSLAKIERRLDRLEQ